MNTEKISDEKFVKVKPQEEKKIVLIGKCPFCKRELRATTQNQFDWNMSLHIRQKHPKDKEAHLKTDLK